MTYTPGEIRAAEYVNSRDVCGTAGDDHDVDRQWTDSAGIVAATILRHRADYDAEGMPILVDDNWLASMAHGVGPGETHLQWEIAIDGRTEPAMLEVCIDNDSPAHEWCWSWDGYDFPTIKTRPQLRALIEVMG